MITLEPPKLQIWTRQRRLRWQPPYEVNTHPETHRPTGASVLRGELLARGSGGAQSAEYLRNSDGASQSQWGSVAAGEDALAQECALRARSPPPCAESKPQTLRCGGVLKRILCTEGPWRCGERNPQAMKCPESPGQRREPATNVLGAERLRQTNLRWRRFPAGKHRLSGASQGDAAPPQPPPKPAPSPQPPPAPSPPAAPTAIKGPHCLQGASSQTQA